MRLRQENGPALTLWIWIVFMTVLTGESALAAKGLSRADLLGYAQWLQRLDTPVETKLYPIGRTEREINALGHARRLTAARAMLDYDESLSRAWDRRDYAGEAQALNHARSCAEILDYDRAMDWYSDAVAARGGASGVDDALACEIFSTAVQSGDSLLVLEQLLNTVGAPRLEKRTGAVTMAYRHYLGRHDDRNVDFLMEKVGGLVNTLPLEIRFWHAFALIERDRASEALPLLEDLCRNVQIAESLERLHVEWFLRALPDVLWLEDRRRDALSLYALLAVREDVEAGRWARYQIANDLLLSGRYEEAEPLLKEACDAADPAFWQLHACELSETVASLNDIRKEGAPYGTDCLHAR